MRRTQIIPIVTLLLGSLTISCVSPYYGTARIEPGWQYSMGTAFHTLRIPNTPGPRYCMGLMQDLHISYGFNRYVKINLNAGFGTALPDGEILIGRGVGVQAAVPLGPVTPALRLEYTGYGVKPSVSPGLLFGIGRREWLTLNVRTHINPNALALQDSLPVIIGAGFHITPELTLWAGGELKTLWIDEYGCFYPIMSAGLGYKFYTGEELEVSHIPPLLVSFVIDGHTGPTTHPFHRMRAAITEGGSTEAGLAYSWLGRMMYPYYNVGTKLRAELAFSYGINPYLALDTRLHVSNHLPHLWFASGFQASLPCGKLTPAFRAEVNTSELGLAVSPSMLLGLGKDEKATLGLRFTYDFYNQEDSNPCFDLFANFRINPIWTIFTGIELLSLSDSFAGLDYPRGVLGVMCSFRKIETRGETSLPEETE